MVRMVRMVRMVCMVRMQIPEEVMREDAMWRFYTRSVGGSVDGYM